MKHLIVIGGGAAGMFCAVNAARIHPDVKITVLEKSNKLLSKVRVSGGGRCNVTHHCSSVSELLKKYPRGANFLKKSFSHFNHADTIKWFEERGVQLKTESDGRMFPVTDSSETIINCLMSDLNRYKVNVMMNAQVKSLVKETETQQFFIHLQNDKSIKADYVCVAAGGHNKLDQFDWLKSTGHNIISPVPSLFTFNMPNDSIRELMGISLPNVLVKIPAFKIKNQGAVLITHWGLSGPAIITLSAWGARQMHQANYQFEAIVQWLPEYHEQQLRDMLLQNCRELASQKIINRNPFGLPERFWKYQMELANINLETRWADLQVAARNKLAVQLTGQKFLVEGKTTFKEEFVTSGGIDLTQIDPHTMESKLLPGLFFAGEIMDVDGVTGGFNFQHAWTSGWIAAKIGNSSS